MIVVGLVFGSSLLLFLPSWSLMETPVVAPIRCRRLDGDPSPDGKPLRSSGQSVS